MNAKLLILVLLGISLMMFGCAKKAGEEKTVPSPEISGGEPQGGSEETVSGQPPEEETGPEIPPSVPGKDGYEQPEAGKNVSADDQKLADLFQIDTDKPVSDEGYDVETPSSD